MLCPLSCGSMGAGVRVAPGTCPWSPAACRTPVPAPMGTSCTIGTSHTAGIAEHPLCSHPLPPCPRPIQAGDNPWWVTPWSQCMGDPTAPAKPYFSSSSCRWYSSNSSRDMPLGRVAALVSLGGAWGSSSPPRRFFRAVVKKEAMGGRLRCPVPCGAQPGPARGRCLQGQQDPGALRIRAGLRH